MYKKTRKFLWFSFSGLIVLCITIFILLGMYMTEKSEEALQEIGAIYMEEVSNQLKEKFEAITALRISQVEGIIRRTPPETAVYGEELLEELSLSAGVREFTYLGFYSESGESETIYGSDVKFFDEQEMKDIINNRSKQISSGYNKEEERLLILAADAEYPMKSGNRSSVLMAAIPMKYLEEALVLEEDNAMVYSHIIRNDGSFVVRTGEAYQDNYLDRIRDESKSEEHALKMKEAMDEGKDYSALIVVGDAHLHLYCSELPGSEWYLVSIMQNGILDESINRLSNQRQYTMLGACSIILIAVLFIFIRYYKMSQEHLQQLYEAEKEAVRANRAKSEFLSNMSHDIRTPMNGIIGMTAIAMTNIQEPARVQDCLKKISLSSKHLLGLINDVLDMSKIESGKLTLNIDVLSLKDTMNSIVNIIQPQIKEKRQHFDIFIQDILAEDVYCDGVRLNQVLINLLSNAIKFTPAEGRINVYLTQEKSPAGEQYVRCHFRVKDNGIGMSPEFQKKIFESFSREDSKVQKIEGTGLGMAITKYIVDKMEGTIGVESEVGSGSEFHVTLDLEKVMVSGGDMVLPPWRMLVVDNNEELCQSAVSALKEIGVSAEWAVSGKKALEMVERHYKSHEDYEVVLLDWKMPDMDGMETARQIRRIVGDDVPILIISAYDWSDIEEEAAEAGIHGFISKPLFKSNLYAELRRFIDEAESLPEEGQESSEKMDFTGRRILLAEDIELNWEIAEDILTEVGFKVEWAENGEICVKKFEESAVGYYDAILMDIRMPVMDGYGATEAIRALKRADAGLPIIAMTADAFAEDIKRSKDAGMNEHISKPIDIGRLIKVLEKYLK
ncbi:MAG: response regulator [Lachnospiraceae bacterium]